MLYGTQVSCGESFESAKKCKGQTLNTMERKVGEGMTAMGCSKFSTSQVLLIHHVSIVSITYAFLPGPRRVQAQEEENHGF